jgi:hypothetical protein
MRLDARWEQQVLELLRMTACPEDRHEMEVKVRRHVGHTHVPCPRLWVDVSRRASPGDLWLEADVRMNDTLDRTQTARIPVAVTGSRQDGIPLATLRLSDLVELIEEARLGWTRMEW